MTLNDCEKILRKKIMLESVWLKGKLFLSTAGAVFINDKKIQCEWMVEKNCTRNEVEFEWMVNERVLLECI